ncbi:MAG TPA: hypothetical protein VGN34_03695, partial [Ktedonobacteraceae bacterium]
ITNQIKPKSETGTHNGHSFTCTFDPNAPPERRWFWHIRFRRTYDVVGGAPDLSRAKAAVRKRIKEIERDVERGIA